MPALGRGEEKSEGAGLAARRARPAVVLADGDDQGVELIIERGVTIGKRAMEQILHGMVIGVRVTEPVAVEDTPAVCVAHEDGDLGGVEEDAIGGLGPDPMDIQEGTAGIVGGKSANGFDASAKAVHEEGDECLQAAGLDVEIAGGPDESREATRRHAVDGERIQCSGCLEVCDGALDVGPGCILGEDRANADLEGSIAGPPVLWPQGAERQMEHAMEETMRARSAFPGSGRRHGWAGGGFESVRKHRATLTVPNVPKRMRHGNSRRGIQSGWA